MFVPIRLVELPGELIGEMEADWWGEGTGPGERLGGGMYGEV